MTLVYCTNIWNHHQGPVCRELARLLGDDFKMILHQPLDHRYSRERMALGWNLVPPAEPWIVRAPESCRNLDYAKHRQLFMAADVAVYGSGLPYVTQEMLVARAKAGKINMRMGERLFRARRPWYYAFCPQKQVGRWLTHHRFEAACVHYLTMGHWCVKDLEYLHACKNRTWRWGYLTSVSEAMPAKPAHEKVVIGWCGRMLHLKQVDLILKAFARLPAEQRARCELLLAGEGEDRESLVRLSKDLGLAASVQFRPFMPQDEAIRFLQSLDIFVFPSNRLEGWGATVLEAMNCGCAVLSNEAAGITLEVIKDGVNGFVFRDGDAQQISCQLEMLIVSPARRCAMGEAAWKTAQGWSPSAGACALAELAHRLVSQEPSSGAVDGICAKVR